MARKLRLVGHETAATPWYLPIAAISLVFFGCASSEQATKAAGSAGAGSSSVTVDAGPLPAVMSDSGHLRFEVRTGPDQPPTRGVSTVSLQITDASTGEPADGLALTVVPWMPAMGHGTSVKPAIDAMGDGAYEVSRVNMYMGGKWDLRIAISGAATDSATLHFSIR